MRVTVADAKRMLSELRDEEEVFFVLYERSTYEEAIGAERRPLSDEQWSNVLASRDARKAEERMDDLFALIVEDERDAEAAAGEVKL